MAKPAPSFLPVPRVFDAATLLFTQPRVATAGGTLVSINEESIIMSALAAGAACAEVLQRALPLLERTSLAADARAALARTEVRHA